MMGPRDSASPRNLELLLLGWPCSPIPRARLTPASAPVPQSCWWLFPASATPPPVFISDKEFTSQVARSLLSCYLGLRGSGGVSGRDNAGGPGEGARLRLCRWRLRKGRLLARQAVAPSMACSCWSWAMGAVLLV